MHYSLYRCSQTWGVYAFAILLCLLLFPYRCDAYTEVFSITKDSNDNTYFVGNRDSDFFIGKKNSLCALQWESTAGSTSGDDNDDGNSEVLHDMVLDQDGAVYAVGSTHGSFTSPSNEVPNLDAAVVVYDSSSGAVIRQKQYDVAPDLDNVAQAISQKPNGNLLVAIYGSVPNIESIATYETRILEIDPETLEVQKVYEIVVTTTENVFSITGGPKLLDFLYEEETNSIIALGHILGRGLLWKYSFDSETVSSQVEWGEAFGNFQISAFTSDGNGAYYVVGSSSEQVLGNNDLQTTVSAEFHAYVVRFDNLDSSNISPTWVRQLAGSGSSQSGNGIDIDPFTGEIVVVGEYDADFSITDAQTSQTFSLNLSTDDGITDVFLWYLDTSTGDFKELRSSSVASTNSEDRGNAISVLSRRTVQIGGITNDGDDAASTACDTTNLLPSPTPSSTPTPSVTPSPTPSTSSSPSSSSSPSQTISPTTSSSKSGIPSDTSSPSPSRSLLSSGFSSAPSSSPFSDAIGTVEADFSPSPPTSQVFPSTSTTPIELQISDSKTPSPSMKSDPSGTSESSFEGQFSQVGSLDVSGSSAAPSQAAVLASFSDSTESSRAPTSSESLSTGEEDIAQSNTNVDFGASADPVIEDGFTTIVSTLPTAVIIDQEDSKTSSNNREAPVIALETQDIGTDAGATEDFTVPRSQEVTSNDELVIDIMETPSENERDAPVVESPQASSSAIIVSFLSTAPSPSSSPLSSQSGMISPTTILSPNFDMDDDPSVSASSLDYSPQSTPQLIPSMTFMFVSVDLGTPTPSSSPSFFKTFPSSSPREAPSTTFNFIVVDLGVSFSPSMSVMDFAADVNFISPTPSSSQTALTVNLGTKTPGFTSEPSSVTERDGKEESSFTPESSLEAPVESSDHGTFSPDQTMFPNEDALVAQISIVLQESKLFPSDILAESSEAFPTSFDAPIEPSSTPLPMFTMSQMNGQEEKMMKSDLLSADSNVDEATISPLSMQDGESASINRPEGSMVVTPLVTEFEELRRAASSPKIPDIDTSSEAAFTIDILHSFRATPELTDDVSATMTEIAPSGKSPSTTIFESSTEPLLPQPKSTTIFSSEDDNDGEETMTSVLPTLEFRFDEVKETPMFTETGSTRAFNSQEVTFAAIPVVPGSPTTMVRESPNLLISSDEPGLRALESFQVAEDASSFSNIPSSPQDESRFMDFIQSPEPSHAFTETLPPSPEPSHAFTESDFSNTFSDDISLVTISPDRKSPQETQLTESVPEASTMISLELFTSPAISTRATIEDGDTDTVSTQSNFVPQVLSSAEVNLPIKSIENSLSSTNPTETPNVSDEEEGNDILQTSFEDEQEIRDPSSSVTFLDIPTEEEEDRHEIEPQQSLAPDVTTFTDPIPSFSPDIFLTELAGSSQMPITSSQSIDESGVKDILASDSPQGPFVSVGTAETFSVPSMDAKEEFESQATSSLSASSEFTSSQDFAKTGRSPAVSPEVFHFTGIAEPEATFDSEQQMGSITSEFSAMTTFSSSLEQATPIPEGILSASPTTTPVSSFIEVPSQPRVPDEQQGAPSNDLMFIETPRFPPEQSLSASIDTSVAFTPLGTTENVPFASADARIQITETPRADDSKGGVFSQEPDESLRIEHSSPPDENPRSTAQLQTPTSTSEFLMKATMDVDRTPGMADFTPGLAASILVESPQSERSRSSETVAPLGAESSLAAISASITMTPRPSISNTVEIPTSTPTPTTTQVIPREPVFSFIDVVFPSATPSSSPKIRTVAVTASPTSDIGAISISPAVSPASSQRIIPISPSVSNGGGSSIPSASSNTSQAVLITLPSATPSSSPVALIVLPSATPSSSPVALIVLPSATPSSSLAALIVLPSATPSSSPAALIVLPSATPSSSLAALIVLPSATPSSSPAALIVLPSSTPSSSLAALIVLPSATPSSSLAVTGSNAVRPSFTAIASQQGESPSPISTEMFSPTTVDNPEESNPLQSPFVSQAQVTLSPSPSSADRGFLTIAPSPQGFETPFISKTPRPAGSINFSQAPISTAVPSSSTAEFPFSPSFGSPTFVPSRTAQASPNGTQGPIPSFSDQPLVQETPTETVLVSIIPSSRTIPPQSLSSPSSVGAPTRDSLESAPPSSLESPSFVPSISSLPSFVGNLTEIPSMSSQPTAQVGSFSASPRASGNILGFTSPTFLLEPSAFQDVNLFLRPSAEGNSEEPTASLLPTQTMEPGTVSVEPVDRTEEPTVAEEIIVQSPATSHDMDDTEEEASITPHAIPSFSEEVEFSTIPSSMPSPSGDLTGSVQPIASSSSNAIPTTSVSARSSPFPTSACVDDGSIIVSPDSLNQTRNFQRVNMVIQVAGPNLTGSCQFTGVIAERFILLSAINTLSQAGMWHITSIENGPPVFDEESTLVGIENEDSPQGAPTLASPSQSNITKRIRFEGSVIFNVTAFMDSLSVELASGSYVEYINSQNIVKVMTAEGFNDILWTGMVSAPRVIDVQIQDGGTRVGSGGLTSGEISAVAIGMLLIVGVAAFVVVEGGISTRGSGAILPI